MPEKKIRSGAEVVDEFLQSLAEDPALNKSTVEAIKSAYIRGRFTSTKLLQELEKKRSATQ